MEYFYFAGLTLFAFIYSLAAMPAASVFARAMGLVDEPTGRKLHSGRIPLAGGMVIFTGLWLALPFLPKNTATWAIVFSSVPLFVIGAMDDRYELSARLRILVQLGVGILLVFGFGLTIEQLDGIASAAPLLLGPVVASVFTVICTCGVLNATNMADGIDGLLGSMSCISLVAISMLCIESNALPEAALSHLMLGLLAGYLAYNLGFFGSGKKVFLGIRRHDCHSVFWYQWRCQVERIPEKELWKSGLMENSLRH